MTVKEEGAPEIINVKVIGLEKSVVTFKFKKNAPLKRLMNGYCERFEVDIETVVFQLDDGVVINEEDTLSSLRVEEGDTIEVYQQHTEDYFF